MEAINIKRIREALEAGKNLIPLAQLLGAPASATGIIQTAADVATAALKAAERGKIALSSTDESELREILEEIQRENDALNERIIASRKA